MHITLAPMEGVIDYFMRELLSDLGGIDLCITEFIRITDTPLPPAVFYRLCPELHQGCTTRNKTPVHIQLLGSNPQMMAWSAVQAVNLGAQAIDINFGCPAKKVNRHQGGAVLLKTPEQIYRIVSAVRQQLPPQIPVTAKMRLGYENTDRALDNAQAIASAGATALAVHARTKVQGYRPPAHWEWLARIRETLAIPVIANGDIWTVDDARRIREISGCDRIMIGRGLLRNPLLAWQIKNQQTSSQMQLWQQNQAVLARFVDTIMRHRHIPAEQHPYHISDSNRYLCTRLKQWLAMMAKSSPQASTLFQHIKRQNCPDAIARTLGL